MRSFGTRIKGALAAALSAALIISGVALAAPTAANAVPLPATVTPVLTVTPEASITAAVTATGLPGEIYAAIIEKDTEANVTPSSGYAAFAAPFPVVTAGEASFALTAPVAKLDRTKPYEVLVWQAHTTADTNTIYGRADLSISPEQWDQLFPPAPVAITTTTSVSSSPAAVTEGAAVTLTATVAPADAAGTVTFKNNGTAISGAANVAVSGGTASVTGIILPVGTNNVTAEFAPTDASLFTASVSATGTVTVNPSVTPPLVPSVGHAATWGLSGYLNSSSMGRPNPSPDNYVVPATFDAVSRISTWGAGIGSVASDGSVHIAYSGKSVNHAKTGGGWLTLANLEVDLDADGNGVMSAEVAYGVANPVGVFDPAQTPVRGEARVNVLSIQGNTATPVVAGGTSTWSELKSLWHADFIAFLAGDGGSISAWSYASTITNTGADDRKPSVITFSYPTVATTTSVSSSAPTVTERTGVDLTATVTPADAAGTVTFKNNGTAISGAANIPVVSGSAAAAGVVLPVGSNNVTAEFTPDIDAVYVASSGATSVTVEARVKAPAGPIIGGTASWGLSGYLNSANMGRPNPSPDNYVVPAAFNADTRISTWGAGTGSVAPDGSVHIAYSGKSVNHAKTGGGWLTLANLEVDLDADGNGVMSAEVAYGVANPAGVFDPAQTPVRGEARVNVLSIQGNLATPVVAGGTSTWSQLKSLWHADFLAFIGGDTDSSIPAWTYASTITNTGAEDRKPSLISFSVKSAAPISYSAAVTNATASSLMIGAEFAGATGITIPVGQGMPGPSAGVYVALIEEGTENSLSAANRGITTAFVPNAAISDGAGSAVLTAEPEDLDRTKNYEIAFWYAHANATTDTIIGVAPLLVSDAQWDLLFGTGNNGGGGDNGGGNNSGDNGGSTPPPAVTPAQGAGSLTWGISSSFSRYITGPIAHGRITTSGVGTGYLFPQASASNWNAATQTGAVQYSGSVNFYGHDGILDLTVANPVITINSATAGTISAGVAVGSLNLGAATKTVGANGEVTWSNVPVSGSISGGSDGLGGSSALDSLTFTVGAASSMNFGSTSVSNTPVSRTVAPTPPATSGVTVVTPDEEMVPGGEIEIEANGFEPNERDVYVVVYSEPIVLDRQAGANANGKVRWIGTLPEDLAPGQHTITLQGSINVGKVITVVSADEAEKAKAQAAKQLKAAAADGELAEAAAGPAAGDSSNAWVWWAGAIGLLILAGGMTALVVTQRRRHDAQ